MDLSDIFKHAALIAVEWGVLHSTILGPILTDFFSETWEFLNMDFMTEGIDHLDHDH